MDKKPSNFGGSRPSNYGNSQHSGGNRPAGSGQHSATPGQGGYNRPAGQQSGRPGGFGGPRPGGPRPAGVRPPLTGPRPPRKEEPYNINERIRAKEVRLVGDNVENGIVSIQQAMRLADELELDLVEISPTAEPSTTRSSFISRKSARRSRKQKLRRW